MKNRIDSENILSVRQSFWEVYAEVEKQIEFDSFEEQYIPQAEEICKIITEVLKLNPRNEIRIAGEMLAVDMVQEIFRDLQHENITHVIDNFKKVTYEITSVKAYLRTALYNSVFETESKGENLFRSTYY